MRKYIYCFVALLLFFGANAQAPGGVAESEIWSKIIKNTAPATTFQYKDFSKNNKSITVGSVTTLTPSVFNYNYSYTYNASSYVSYLSKLESMKDATIFIVNQPTQLQPFALMNSDWNASVVVPSGTVSEQSFTFSTEKVVKNTAVLTYPTSTAVRPNARVNSLIWHNFNSKKIINSYGVNGESNIFVGKAFTGAANFIGDIPEFIVYRRALNDKEKLRVESYLALKYGITLHQDQDYVSSKGQIYWHKSNNPIFKNRIFGLGRDSNTSLYQRQTTSAHDPFKLIVWTGTLVADNYLNTSYIDDQSYLSFGDNNLAEVPNTVLNRGIKKIDRIWLAEKFGAGTPNLVTNLKYKKDNSITLLPNEAFWLLVDKSATNTTASNFNGTNIDYYQDLSFDANGYAEFNNLKWASTTTTYNQFTFGVGPKMIVLPSVTMLDCTSGSLTANIKGGLSVFTINIHGTDNSYNNQFNTTSPNFSQVLAIGSYLVSVTDATGYLVQTPVVVTALPGIAINLGADFTFVTPNTYTLNAGTLVTNPNVTYAWYKNGILETTVTPTYVVNTAPTATPDIYKCIITNTLNGCTIEDSVLVSPPPVPRLGQYAMVYPNPTKSNFTLEIGFEEIKNVEITLTDIAGKILQTDFDSGMNLSRNYALLTSGVYFVNIKATDYDKTLKIIIN